MTQLSDFGTLTSLGAGLNWSPAPRMTLITSWTREEGAPSLQQLGDPPLETPGVRFFDFTRADRSNALKIGGNWQPSEKLDLRLRAEYVRQTIDNPQASFPAVTEALEDAFPGRFERDLLSGNLLRVDVVAARYRQYLQQPS